MACSPALPAPCKQNMSNAVLAFAKLEYRPPDSCLEGLARTALQRIKTFSPQVGGWWAAGCAALDGRSAGGCCICVWT